MSNFHEACNVGAFHIVDVTIGFSTVFHTLCVDVVHDAMKFFVNFGFAPREVHCVLAHFETRSGNTTGIDSQDHTLLWRQ